MPEAGIGMELAAVAWLAGALNSFVLAGRKLPILATQSTMRVLPDIHALEPVGERLVMLALTKIVLTYLGAEWVVDLEIVRLAFSPISMLALAVAPGLLAQIASADVSMNGYGQLRLASALAVIALVLLSLWTGHYGPLVLWFGGASIGALGRPLVRSSQRHKSMLLVKAVVYIVGIVAALQLEPTGHDLRLIWILGLTVAVANILPLKLALVLTRGNDLTRYRSMIAV
jgi:hypothetical protein